MVKTGDENDAGTDANVNFQMFGEKGKTQNFSLREEGDKKRFEKGRMDKFLINKKMYSSSHLFWFWASSSAGPRITRCLFGRIDIAI